MTARACMEMFPQLSGFAALVDPKAQVSLGKLG